MGMFDSLVPECRYRDTLEDGGEQGANRPADDNEQICETEPSEDVADEYSEIQEENRDFIEAEDQFVEDLCEVKPL